MWSLVGPTGSARERENDKKTDVRGPKTRPKPTKQSAAPRKRTTLRATVRLPAALRSALGEHQAETITELVALREAVGGRASAQLRANRSWALRSTTPAGGGTDRKSVV